MQLHFKGRGIGGEGEGGDLGKVEPVMESAPLP